MISINSPSLENKVEMIKNVEAVRKYKYIAAAKRKVGKNTSVAWKEILQWKLLLALKI